MIFAVDMEAALEISYICLGRNLASVISKRDFGKTGCFGADFACSAVLTAISSVLQFASPLVVKLLIGSV